VADREERPRQPQSRPINLEPGDASRRRLTPTLCPKNRARYNAATRGGNLDYRASTAQHSGILTVPRCDHGLASWQLIRHCDLI
jgi:hypothetical protein